MKKTIIIILNWNGANDTIACLETLLALQGNFSVLVVDNASSDDSLKRIEQWIVTNEGRISVEVLPLEQNYGFAIGNNKGIAYALKYAPDYYLLLNNDTEVTSDFLMKLITFAESHPEFRVLTPKIYCFYDKRKIWNCGGKLLMGFRKYYYSGQTDEAIKEHGFIPISFVTGCALFFSSDLLDERRILFTERFFFGEEDFEFSMRMSKQRVKMACVLDSVIYHKVSASSSRMNVLGKIYLHYLNRFIDIYINKSKLFYFFWVLINIPLCILHFYKASHSVVASLKFVWHLLLDVQKKQGVSHSDFEALVINKTYFE